MRKRGEGSLAWLGGWRSGLMSLVGLLISLCGFGLLISLALGWLAGLLISLAGCLTDQLGLQVSGFTDQLDSDQLGWLTNQLGWLTDQVDGLAY